MRGPAILLPLVAAACGGGGAVSDNTKFQAACLKNLEDWRCDCAMKAVRTSMGDDDFHRVAEWIEPGKFGSRYDSSTLAEGISDLVGRRYRAGRDTDLRYCIGIISPFESQTNFGGRHPAKVIAELVDDMGRYKSGPNQGKRGYELAAEHGR